ncbi:MAG: arsenosugar biosynthesis radical SAM (seleno)protein ArsS [Myxococcota bacterium]|nr:arsenosugar biosynthesis radical SAM (seleno)protein ArsS [Myxococcota bacterium]
MDTALNNAFERMLTAHGIAPLRRRSPATVQINLGKRCNQTCRHCHVGAGPTRTEAMDNQTMDRLLTVLEHSDCVDTVDITGGAPELHPRFRHLVRAVHRLGHRIIDRCNLTVLMLPDHRDTAEFLANHDVEVVASLPCYGPDNVDRQRGSGTFQQSIAALQRLNALGYGAPGGSRVLNLVYNPLGPFLPPNQDDLEADYKARLETDYGIRFNQLFTITNMPIARFKADLSREGQLEAYLGLLQTSFNPAAVDAVMCRDLISIGFDGSLYACDFNQMLDLRDQGTPKTLWEIETFGAIEAKSIATGAHCLGCTAGAGSSCGGALQ